MRVPSGSCAIRPDGTIAKATLHFLKMIGYPKGEVVEKKEFATLIREGPERENFPIFLLEARRRGSVENIEVELEKSDGTPFPVSIDLLAMNGNGRNLTSVKARVEDITFIRNREQRLTRSRDAYFNMLKDLHSSLEETEQLLEEIILAFSKAIDAKSHWTMGHSERVARYSVEIAREMALGRKTIDDLRTAALLHDLGKIGTYDEILDKPTKLTPQEFELVKKHPIKGIDILGPIKKMEAILPVIIHHHERWDGTGYPDGLEGEQIPLSARILSVADAYDSMIATRPYRPSLGSNMAIAELNRLAGAQFDAEVVAALEQIIKRQKG